MVALCEYFVNTIVHCGILTTFSCCCLYCDQLSQTFINFLMLRHSSDILMCFVENVLRTRNELRIIV